MYVYIYIYIYRVMHMYVNSLDPIVSDGNKLFSAQAHHERILLVKDLDPLDVAVFY